MYKYVLVHTGMLYPLVDVCTSMYQYVRVCTSMYLISQNFGTNHFFPEIILENEI